MAEIPYDLAKDQTTGTKRYYGFRAILEAVLWWIHTPIWSKINRPDWGHRFEKYQHEAMTEGILQDIEAETVIYIEIDFPGIRVGAVYATPTQEDAICKIAIVISDGTEMGLVADRITT